MRIQARKQNGRVVYLSYLPKEMIEKFGLSKGDKIVYHFRQEPITITFEKSKGIKRVTETYIKQDTTTHDNPKQKQEESSAIKWLRSIKPK